MIIFNLWACLFSSYDVIFNVIFFLEYTDMTITKVTERVSVYYSGQLSVLKYLLNQSCGVLEIVDEKKFKAFKNINIIIENKIITLEV